MIDRAERTQTLATHVRQARTHQLGSTRAAAAAAKVARNTWTKIEDGESVRSDIYARAEIVLDWRHGSIERYLQGKGELPERLNASDEGEDVLIARSVEGVPEGIRAQFATYKLETPLDQAVFLQELALRILGEMATESDASSDS